MRLSAADAALVSTIYDPPRACRAWTLTDVLPGGETAYYSLGRWALVDALRACGVGAGDRVLVPSLICREVMASINAVQAKPVFYPVSDQLSARLSDGTVEPVRAVIAVNYFGFPQDLGVFRQYCSRHGASLIEDNAHGLMSRDSDGRLLGSRGDAGVFSFRKTIAVPDGGALVLNRGAVQAVPSPPPVQRASSTRYRVKQRFRRLSRSAGPTTTFAALALARTLRRPFTGSARGAEQVDAETDFPMPPAPGRWVSEPITVAEPELETRRRRSLYELAARILDTSGGVPVFRELPPNVVPYGFPVFASSSSAVGVARAASRHGFQLCHWPDLPVAVAASAPPHYRNLMVLPFLW